LSHPSRSPTHSLTSLLIHPTDVTCVPPFHQFQNRLFGEKHNLCTFRRWTVIHPPANSSRVPPIYSLSILNCSTRSLCSQLNVRYRVSHPYRTLNKTAVRIFIVTFFHRTLEDKNFRTGLQTLLAEFNLLFISSRMQFLLIV